MLDPWFSLDSGPLASKAEEARQAVRAADLVLVLTPQLTGAAAALLDCPVARSTTGLQYSQGGALGLVVVATQFTHWDTLATLKAGYSHSNKH